MNSVVNAKFPFSETAIDKRKAHKAFAIERSIPIATTKGGYACI